jgi:hypothetical protein
LYPDALSCVWPMPTMTQRNKSATEAMFRLHGSCAGRMLMPRVLPQGACAWPRCVVMVGVLQQHANLIFVRGGGAAARES